MRERALTLGPANLVGVVTQPDPDDADPDLPALVILNSGILHRVGASRLYVQVARHLAEVGVTTLRFDFSGVGDSEVRRGEPIPIEERFTVETREAMDYLHAAFGMETFVLGGLCSGADGAFWAGLADDRVVGVWQIDGFCYRTFGYARRRYGPKLLSPKAWVHSIKARMAPKPMAGAADKDEEQFVKPEYRRIFPPRSEVEEGLGRLLDRGVALYFLFTDGLEEYNYAEQHEEAFRSIDLGRRALIRYIPGATHLVTDLRHQELLLRDLEGWVTHIGAPRRSATV